MKYLSLIIFFNFSFASLYVSAQKKKLQEPKDSSVCINEVYLYERDDNFYYRTERNIFEWIEIYNGTSQPIYIRDLFLTDDPNEPCKWQINPISTQNTWLRKNKFFPVYLHGRAKRNGALLSEYEPNKAYLFLAKKENGTIVMLDTIKLPSDNKYPYSRYPDGGDFITTEVLTPGSENLLLNESESRKIYGATAQIGWATASSDEFQNSSYPRLAGAAGIYSRTNLGLVAIEYGLRLGIRGFRIDYSGTQKTNTGTWDNNSNGRRTVYYLDFPYYISANLSKKLSFFGGPMLSLRIKSVTSYKTERTFTYDAPSTKPPVHQSTTYRSHEGNPALDLVDLSIVAGLRYRLNETVNISVYYMRDLTGLNIGTAGGLATQTNKGIYVSIEKPLLFSKRRVKRNGIF